MPIITDLISYYSFQGDLNDAHGTNHLTNNNGVTFVSGLVGQEANFVAASNQFGSIAHNANLILANCTICGWVKFNAGQIGTATTVDPIAKWIGGTANLQNFVIRKTSADVMQAIVSSDGSNTDSVSSAVAITASTRFFVAFRHDGVAHTIDIRVNATDATPVSHLNDIFPGASDLNVGCITSGTTNLDGTMDEWGIWRLRRLSDADLDWLYNSGAGRSYADIVAEAGGGGGFLLVAN